MNSIALKLLFERICFSCPGTGSIVIVLESRGKEEDKALLQSIVSLLTNGNSFNRPGLFSRIAGVYFNPKWSWQYDRKKSYWELEIADLCTYPVHKYCTFGTKDRAFGILENKIINYPDISGYGLEKFP